MSDPLLAELKASIRKNLGSVERQVESLQMALDRDLALLGRTQNAALIVAGLLVKKMKQAHPGVKQDLERFLSFLDRL